MPYQLETGVRSDRYMFKVSWLPIWLPCFYAALAITFDEYLNSIKFLQQDEVGSGIVDVIRQNANGAILYIFVYSLYRLCSDYTTLLLDSDQIPDEVKMTLRAIELVFPGVATTLSNCESFLIYLLNYLSPYYVATNIMQGCFALKSRIEKISTLDGYTEWFKALLSRRHPQLHYFTLQCARLHYTIPRYSTQHYSTL